MNMRRTDSVFTLLPPVKNVRQTPFKERDATRLIYSPELIKTVFARRYYHNHSWSKIALELKIDRDQAVHAFARGRVLKVNPKWANVTPLIEYEQVRVTATTPTMPSLNPKKSYVKRKWSDELVVWVLAQHSLMQRSVSAIQRSLELLYPISGGPSYSVITKWLDRKTMQTQALDVKAEALELFPFYETKDPDLGRPPVKRSATKPKPISAAMLRRQRNAEARAKGREFLKHQEQQHDPCKA